MAEADVLYHRNLLREDWKPVLSLQSIMVGLQYLFLEPCVPPFHHLLIIELICDACSRNADDPLNKEAADVLRRDRQQFAKNVTTSMRGGTVGGQTYDRVLR